MLEPIRTEGSSEAEVGALLATAQARMQRALSEMAARR